MSGNIDEELEIMDEKYEQHDPKLELALSIDGPIENLVYREPVVVSKSASLTEVLDLLRGKDVSCVFVEEAGTLIGIFTERDIVRKISNKNINYDDAKIEDYMTKNPETLSPKAPLAFALNKMAAGGFRHIPLINDEGKLVGYLSFRNIVEHLADFYSDEILNLPPSPEQFQDSREGG